MADETQSITLDTVDVIAKRETAPVTTAGGVYWLRQCNLTVTDEKQGSQTANRLDLSAFRITFDVNAALNQSPKSMIARVYNLGRETTGLVLKQFTTISLVAGYTGTADVIFKGAISYFESGRESPTETVLTIHANDSDFNINGTPINLTLEKGHTHSDIVTACIKTMGLQPGVISDLDPSKSPRGRACVGMPKDVLRDIAQANNATVSFDGGKVNILKLNETFKEVAIVLNSGSGMIGTPRLTMNGAVEVTSLLNARLGPGAGVVIREADVLNITPATPIGTPGVEQSQVAVDAQLQKFVANSLKKGDGFYKVASVHHQGDTRGNPWYSHLVTMPANPADAASKPSVK